MTSPTDSLKEDLLKLAGLSQTESKILECKNLLQSLPANLKEMEQKKEKVDQLFKTKKQNLEDLERNYRQLETELSDSKEKTKTRETKLFEIKTTKEYQATTKEIAATKKLNLERETTLLQMMEQIETLKKDLSPLEEEAILLQQKIENENKEMSSELERIQGQLTEQLKIKEELCSSIDNVLMGRYEKVLIRRQPAIAAVKSGICQECNMNVRPQVYIEIQKCKEVIHCPSCNRILYISLES